MYFLVWDGLNGVKRVAVLKRLKRLKQQARRAGLDFEVTELTRHTAVRVGDVTRTLGLHSEVDDVTAGKFFDQYADVLGGKGWWR